MAACNHCNGNDEHPGVNTLHSKSNLKKLGTNGSNSRMMFVYAWDPYSNIIFHSSKHAEQLVENKKGRQGKAPSLAESRVPAIPIIRPG